MTHYTSPNYTDRPQVNYTVLKIFSQFTIWATCACPEKKTVAPKIFTIVNIVFTFRIFNSFRLPWKQIFPWNFSLYWIYFLLFRIFEQRRLPWKKQSCPAIFHCIEIYFIIQDFWAASALPEKESCPENFHCMEYTFTFWIFEQLALVLKKSLP